jgi:flagellar biosynthesis anti-sigma factor FlgM
MRINDTNGLGNGVGNLGATQTGRSESPSVVSPGKSGSGSGKTGSSSDRVELSSFTGRMSQTMQADAASRAQRVSQIAAAVRSGTYKVDSMAVSKAIIDQAVASGTSGGAE